MDENQMPQGGGAGDELAAPADSGAKTLTIPSDLLPNVKPGDALKVQSVADGNVTLEHTAGEAQGEDEDWTAAAKQAVGQGE